MSIEPVVPLPGPLAGRFTARPDAAPHTPAHRPADRFDEAVQSMQAARWPAAFAILAALADEGHPHAARIALVFVRRGTSLFGGTFAATAAQRCLWESVAA